MVHKRLDITAADIGLEADWVAWQSYCGFISKVQMIDVNDCVAGHHLDKLRLLRRLRKRVSVSVVNINALGAVNHRVVWLISAKIMSSVCRHADQHHPT